MKGVRRKETRTRGVRIRKETKTKGVRRRKRGIENKTRGKEKTK